MNHFRGIDVPKSTVNHHDFIRYMGMSPPKWMSEAVSVWSKKAWQFSLLNLCKTLKTKPLKFDFFLDKDLR